MAWADLADKVVAAGCKAFGGPDVVVNYQPAAAPAFDLDSGGVFTAAGEIVNLGDGIEVASPQPMLGVRLADFPAGQQPAAGDLLTRAGTTWKVAEVQDDGVAGARLMLHRTA